MVQRKQKSRDNRDLNKEIKGVKDVKVVSMSVVNGNKKGNANIVKHMGNNKEDNSQHKVTTNMLINLHGVSMV